MTDVPPSPPRTGRGPEVIDLTAKAGPSVRKAVIIEEGSFAEEPEVQAIVAGSAPTRSRGWFAGVVWAAFGLLAGLYLTDFLWSLVLSLQMKNPLLGQIALGLALVVAIGILVWLLGEVIAVLRLRGVERLRRDEAAVRSSARESEIRAFIARFVAFHQADPSTAAARAQLAETMAGIHDGPTLLDEAERLILGPKDAEARRLIAEAAQRVSLVTALSPRAIVDMLFVLVQSVRLIRQISAVYGARASGLGLLRLSTRIFAHVAVTGGVAAADSVISQVLGSGLAARLSAKLGEGVLNGILTARVGIAAAELSRPLSYHANPPIILSEVVKISLNKAKVAENPAASS